MKEPFRLRCFRPLSQKNITIPRTAATKATPPIVAPATGAATLLLLLETGVSPTAAVDEVAELEDSVVLNEFEVVLGALDDVSAPALELGFGWSVEIEDTLEVVEVAESVNGLNVTPVNTTCNNILVGCPA